MQVLHNVKLFRIVLDTSLASKLVPNVTNPIWTKEYRFMDTRDHRSYVMLEFLTAWLL